MAERTETEKLTGAPERVALGGEPMEIHGLPLGESLEWNERVIRVVDEVFSEASETSAVRARNVLIARAQADLIASYCGLTGEEVERATRAELSAAWAAIVRLEGIVCPFGLMSRAMDRLVSAPGETQASG